jgi:hypothetical protein
MKARITRRTTIFLVLSVTLSPPALYPIFKQHAFKTCR